MKITRSQLKQIIQEEAAEVSELEKQGFFKRMAGKIGMGGIKNFVRDVKRLQREVRSFLDNSPDVWDSPRATKQYFDNRSDEISGWLQKLAEYANATADQVPNKVHREYANKLGTRLTKEITGAAERADNETAARIKQEAEESKRRAAKAARDREAAAEQRRVDAYDPDQGLRNLRARRAADDRGAEVWRNDNRGMRGAFEENKKLTLSSLQQIIQEEIAKLNETK